MIRGVFVRNTPWVKIVIGWNQSVQAPFVVLDTGFTGDLQVTPKIAKELNLQISGVTKTQIANGQIVDVPVALAIASMESMQKYITKFFYRASLDCKNRTITLRRV